MKNNNTQLLRFKHRLELVMKEFGEEFDIQGDQWHSTTTRGLVVNIRLQTYEYQMPGTNKETGDLYDWLRMRFSWSFKQAFRYLQKRRLDPEQDLQIEKVDKKIKVDMPPLANHVWKFECQFPDEEKEACGLYDWGLVDRGDGKPFYQYLLRPIDQWQDRALEIYGEEIRECFTWHSWEIDSLLRSQPYRFVPVMDMDIERCDECEKPIEWWWKKKPVFGYQETFSPGIRFGPEPIP